MSRCPKCLQEYDEGYTECADCLVPLQSDDALAQAGDAAAMGQQQRAAVFKADSAEVLDLMYRAVALHHFPAQTADTIPGHDAKGHFLIVPLEYGEKVLGILEKGLPMLIGEGEGADRSYRHYQPGKDHEIRDPELLRQSTSDLVAQGDDVIDELIEIVARGDVAARNRAAYVLACMGENGVMALTQLLRIAIEKAQHDTAISLIKVMRNELEPGQNWNLFCEYLTASSDSKILALQALTALASIEVFHDVLPLLEDPDPEVRDEADNTLCTLADEDMGFDSNAPEEERRAAINKWENWWLGRNHG